MKPVIRYQSQLLYRKSYKPNRVIRNRPAKPGRLFRPRSPTEDRMNANHLPNKFTAIGARLKMQLTEPRHWREDDYVVDIYHRRHGGFMPVRMPQRTRRRQPERHAGRRTSDGHISVPAALYPE